MLDNSNAAFDGAVYRGHDGLREWLSWLRGMWKRQQFGPQEFIPVGEGRVIVPVPARQRWQRRCRDGRPRRAATTLREGKVIHLKTFQSKAEALEAEAPAVEDPVDAWGIQSFPASDPPQWWAGAPD